MTELTDLLERVKNKFNGRQLNTDEEELLKLNFHQNSVLNKLLPILRDHAIIGQDFSLSEEADKSTMGVEMQWMTPNDQVEEAFEYYPGIATDKSVYIPIGTCLEGSGNPYFMSLRDDELVICRIIHDSVDENDTIIESGIEPICKFSELILNL